MIPSASLRHFTPRNQRHEPASTDRANPTQDSTYPPTALSNASVNAANPQTVIPRHLWPYEQPLVPVYTYPPAVPVYTYPPTALSNASVNATNPQTVIPRHLRPYEQPLVPVYTYPPAVPVYTYPPALVPVICIYPLNTGQYPQTVIPPYLHRQGITNTASLNRDFTYKQSCGYTAAKSRDVSLKISRIFLTWGYLHLAVSLSSEQRRSLAWLLDPPKEELAHLSRAEIDDAFSHLRFFVNQCQTLESAVSLLDKLQPPPSIETSAISSWFQKLRENNRLPPVSKDPLYLPRRSDRTIDWDEVLQQLPSHITSRPDFGQLQEKIDEAAKPVPFL